MGQAIGAWFTRPENATLLLLATSAALFEQEIQNGTDPDLKQFARQTLPKIVDHLQRAEKLAAAAGGRLASK